MSAIMADTLPTSTDPATIAVLLDWLHDRLPAPKAPRWQGDTTPGFTTSRRAADWSDCPACGGKGKRRKGQSCPTCAGTGGHYTDPMDSKHRDLRVESDARPPSATPARLVKLSSTTDDELADADWLIAPALAAVAAALDDLRTVNRYERAILQRVHIIRLDTVRGLRPAELDLYTRALDHLALLLPDRFRAPRWCRERAAERIRRAA